MVALADQTDPDRSQRWGVRVAMAVGAAAMADRERWALWLPVALGLGVLSYFALPVEPPAAAPAIGLAVCGAVLSVGRGRAWVRLPALALLAFTLGVAAGQWQTQRVQAPVLQRALGPVTVEGRVVLQDVLPRGTRVVLDRLAIERVEGWRTPHRVRITLGRGDAAPPTGSRIRILASLRPPPPAVMPGAYDFRMRAYFDRLGATGFAFGRHAVIQPGDPDQVGLALERLRQSVVETVLATLDGDAAAVAAALLTGERGSLREAVYEDLRDSGLAHLLAISGLHVGLVAGLVFAGVRAGLAVSERLALTWPLKKIAAAAALAAAFFYMLIVGATVPTQRAFLMTGLVLVAVLVDREAFSMRLVALAAALVMLISPFSVLGPSFQMSFAAVIALIAAYEALGRDRFAQAGDRGWGRRVALYFAGVLLTSLIASAATGPFALFHFQRIAGYGLIANLIAVPLTALWIMPFGVVAYALMPVGLAWIGLVPMGWGIDLLLTVAAEAASWPGAAWSVAAPSAAALGLMTAGGLWLCLWMGRWRLLGAAPILVGAVLMALPGRPEILIDGSTGTVAIRHGDRLYLSGEAISDYALDVWARRLAIAPEAVAVWREPAVAFPDRASLACDSLGCRLAGDVLILVDRRGWPETCRSPDLVVTPLFAPSGCEPGRLIDARALGRIAAATVDLRPSGRPPTIDTVPWRGGRPWEGERR